LPRRHASRREPSRRLPTGRLWTGVGHAVGEQPVGLLGRATGEVARRLDPQRHRAERRPEAVVQVPPQPPPLLLARGDQRLPAGLQLLGELRCARRRGSLPDDVGQQALVAVGQPRARRWGEHELADVLPP
jgi:hypothetical protein